jgi:hypothetical protein
MAVIDAFKLIGREKELEKRRRVLQSNQSELMDNSIVPDALYRTL